VKARLLLSDGRYVRVPVSGTAFSAQDFLISCAEGRATAANIPHASTDHEPTARHPHKKTDARKTKKKKK